MSGAGSFLGGFAGGFDSGRSIIDRRKRMDQNQDMIEAMRSQPQQPPQPQSQPSARRPGSPPPVSIGDWDASSVDPRIASGTREAAEALGIDPVDLATAISYETAGTFDPVKPGPTTKWGQHRGAIQWGEPQAQEYGVNWDDPIGSQFGGDGAIVKYLRARGVKPGMGLLDVYSAINAGAPGLYNRSDAGNGGAPGTVADKVRDQMAGHRAKAERLFAHYAPDQPVQAEARNAPARTVMPQRSKGEELLARFFKN